MLLFFTLRNGKLYSLDNNVNVKRLKSIAKFNEEDSPKSRLLMWEAGLGIFKEHPFTGVGKKNSAKYYLEYMENNNFYERIASPWVLKQNAEGENPHNMYVNTLVENGIIVFILTMAFGGYLFFKNIKLNIFLKKNNSNKYYITLGTLCGSIAYYCIGVMENNFVVFWAFTTFSILLIVGISIENSFVLCEKNKEVKDCENFV